MGRFLGGFGPLGPYWKKLLRFWNFFFRFTFCDLTPWPVGPKTNIVTTYSDCKNVLDLRVPTFGENYPIAPKRWYDTTWHLGTSKLPADLPLGVFGGMMKMCLPWMPITWFGFLIKSCQVSQWLYRSTFFGKNCPEYSEKHYNVFPRPYGVQWHLMLANVWFQVTRPKTQNFVFSD